MSIGGRDLTWNIDEDRFAQLCEPLVQRMRGPIERAMRDAKLQPSQLDEIVLVGGASRMPLVARLVSRMFGRLPLRHVNPDQAIALGGEVGSLLPDQLAKLTCMSRQRTQAQAHCQQRSQEQNGDQQRPKPPGLRPVGMHDEVEHRTLRIPDATVVAGGDTKAVAARRQIGEHGGATIARVDPVRIFALKLEAIAHRGGVNQAESDKTEVDATPPRLEYQRLLRCRQGDRLEVDLSRFDVHRWRPWIAHQESRGIDHRDAT